MSAMQPRPPKAPVPTRGFSRAEQRAKRRRRPAARAKSASVRPARAGLIELGIVLEPDLQRQPPRPIARRRPRRRQSATARACRDRARARRSASSVSSSPASGPGPVRFVRRQRAAARKQGDGFVHGVFLRTWAAAGRARTVAFLTAFRPAVNRLHPPHCASRRARARALTGAGNRGMALRDDPIRNDPRDRAGSLRSCAGGRPTPTPRGRIGDAAT